MEMNAETVFLWVMAVALIVFMVLFVVWVMAS
jgi:hypothetical protein